MMHEGAIGLLLQTFRRKGAHSPFEICRTFERFIANVTFVYQERLKLGVYLFGQRKESTQHHF